MASCPRYKYVRINSPFVRILHFAPGPGEDLEQDATISGTLRTISLDRPESFDAISYACGDPNNRHSICIDRKVILVSKNCHDGLRHLRDILGVQRVWVDAVSINAIDVDERNEQLRLMTKIYGTARRVYIWLGPTTPACERALDWLNDTALTEHTLLGARLALFPDFLRPAEIRRILPVFADVLRARLRQYGLTRPLAYCGAEALQDLTSREWFTRLWTVQEAAMASEGWAVCGTKKIRWNRLVFGLIKAQQSGLLGEETTKLDPVRVIFQFWVDISNVSNFKVWPHRRWLNSWVSETSTCRGNWTKLLDRMEGHVWKVVRLQFALAAIIATARLLQGLRPFDSVPLAVMVWLGVLIAIIAPPKSNPHWDRQLRESLVDVLHQSRRQQATDKKDKVYALYGLLEQLDISFEIEPAYDDSHSLEDAYRRFTTSIIEWHGSLEILLEASGPWGKDAPSWVPDWSIAYKRLHFSRKEIGSPPAQTQQEYKFSGDPRRLSVSGQEIGKIVFAGRPINGEPGSLNQISKNVQSLTDWLKRVLSVYNFSSHDVCHFLMCALLEQKRCSEEDLKAWSTISLQAEPSYPENEQGGAEPVETAGRRIVDEIQMLGLHLRPGHDGASWRRLLKIASNRQIWQIHQSITASLSGGLTLFVAQITDSGGHLLGLGPDRIRVQDDVVRFASLGVSMILRPRSFAIGNDTFHLIGAARLSRVGATAETRPGKKEFTLV